MRPDPVPFGQTSGGVPVESYLLEHPGGPRARVMTYGATLLELWVPDRAGRLADVVLGFDALERYESGENPYFGCIVGRCANRIARGELVIDGRRSRLTLNEGRNHLHGGLRGLSRVVWEARAVPDGRGPSLRFTHESPPGEEGYPGRLRVEVTYTLTGAAELWIEYEASADRATPVNLTHHSYFNLAGAGAGTILDHELWVAAAGYTPVDDELIPTGALEPVAGTALDFTRARPIGARIGELERAPFHGYDHNFALDHPGGGPALAARLQDPRSGRALELWTTEPGLQLYTGNHLAALAGKGGALYPRHGGLSLEAQGFPDAVHHPSFPSVILRPGETYRQRTAYRFGVSSRAGSSR